MDIAYCLTCKREREVTHARYKTAANGVECVKGVCPIYGTKIARFLGKAATRKGPTA